MLRSICSKTVSVARAATRSHLLKHKPVICLAANYSVPVEHYEVDISALNQEAMVEVLQDETFTAYDLREMVNNVQTRDMIPCAEVLKAMMLVCRRVNDYAMAVRILEALRFKCKGREEKEIYADLMQSLEPTLTKLGILTPEQMGYDEPELHLVNVFDIH